MLLQAPLKGAKTRGVVALDEATHGISRKQVLMYFRFFPRQKNKNDRGCATLRDTAHTTRAAV